MKWKLKGGHKQKTRSGYNFWKPFTSQTKDGVTLTVKDDGSYVLSGTATKITSFYVNGLNYDAADYTIALFNSTAISNEGFYVQVEHENGLLKQAFLTTNIIKSGTTGKINALSIVIPADLTLNNFTFKPMLLKGIYTANTMLRFEQYGMMPSTDYPSEIKTVGSNVNLFDGTIKASNQRISTSGTGTYAAQGYSISDYIEILSDTDYIISTDESFYCLYDKDKKFISGNSFSNRKKCTTNSNAKYIKFDFKTEEANKIKLEKGSTATPGSAYGTGCVEIKVQNSEEEQTIVMPVQQEMLQGDYIEDVEHHEWGKIIITGEENWVAEAVGRFSIGKEIYISRPKTPPTNDDYVGNLCNCYAEKTPTLTWNKKQGFCVTRSGGYLAIYDNTYSPNSDVNGFKAWLKSKYDANDPVVVYYKLANAIDLELTEAQKAVREQKLHTYKNITNINLSDELASIDVTYKKDLDTILNNLQAQIIANASEEVTE